MFTIRFDTQKYRPDLRVTIRAANDGWKRDVPGVYEDDAWSFILSETDFPGGHITFKFVLDRVAWMSGGNLTRAVHKDAVLVFDETEVAFAPNELIVDNPYLQRWMFPPALNETHTYDVVIVGSGMGGGILADQLSDHGADVLVLEAGSYLFPTHVGNLPRRHGLGHFDKHLWNLYDKGFKVFNYAAGSGFAGGQAFLLGGRSVFWGGLIPRMSWWELDAWPQTIRWYLESSGYQRAEDLMNRTSPPASTYAQDVRRFLRTNLPDFAHGDAPMAVDYRPRAAALFSSGIFSTADLLTESRLTPGATGNQNLQVNLNHAAVQLEVAGNAVTGVAALDLIANRKRTFKGSTYVLAAGTLESAKLAQLSGLRDPNGRIGAGLTDHPIFFVHFGLPNGEALYRASDSAKTLSQHGQATSAVSPYNLVLELGADLNQGRYVDDDTYDSHVAARGEAMLCELVFLLNAALIDANTVVQTGPSDQKPVVTMQRAVVSRALRDEMQAHADTLLQQLGAVALPNEDLVLKLADLGGVAHEAGTLRLAGDGSGVVDEDLKFLGYDNLYACDLSVFASSPAANPSLTLAALAIRLADHLAA